MHDIYLPPHMGCVEWTMFDKQLGWWFEKKVLNDGKKTANMNSTTNIHMLL